ncbi:MAG: nitronate monooxygenase [Lachnospiraceae bacterium]|nr:nitronate monooxygenase [Lachnospiraceae bacterium]
MIIRGKEFSIPIIQGGMGVGVSLGNLAGHVALCGGIGIISSVNAGYRKEDFQTNPRQANLRALEQEIKKAKEIADGHGLVGVNIMTAVTGYEETVKTAVAAGADVIISGAGLPMKLPEYLAGSDTLCAPIVSSARAAKLLLNQYQKRYQTKPDFFVLEGHLAGGHLGFSKEELFDHQAKSNDEILEELLVVAGDIPVFVAGGVFDGNDMAHFVKKGAAGVQIGTRFIATEECDAAQCFKDVILAAKEEDLRIIVSPVGMPARAVFSPLLKRLKDGEKFPAIRCNNCLTACKKNDATPYCISRALIEAAKGNKEDGLFFTGANAGRINRMYSVRELISEIYEEYREAME